MADSAGAISPEYLVTQEASSRTASPGCLTPKRSKAETSGLADLFPYYAGFHFEWARSEIQKHRRSATSLIVDPWNGSGTTTLAASSLGIKSIGVDLNPIVNIAARLRMACCESLDVIQPPNQSKREAHGDPLESWLNPSTICRVRDWTRKLSKLPSETTAFGYVALFRVIRGATKKFEGSNPTWVRRARNRAELVDILPSDLDNLLLEEQAFMKAKMRCLSSHSAPAMLATASANRLPLPRECADLVLTSPPYLTRIDYAVAYARELAVYGVDVASDRKLRAKLMGTTLIRETKPTLPEVGPLAQELVRDVSFHDSKASSGYYRKQIVQYLTDLTAGLDEITRITKPNARVIMVVQDSYYKDIPVRLAEICQDEATRRGWSCTSRNFVVKQALTSLNRAARVYRKGSVYETILTMARGD